MYEFCTHKGLEISDVRTKDSTLNSKSYQTFVCWGSPLFHSFNLFEGWIAEAQGTLLIITDDQLESHADTANHASWPSKPGAESRILCGWNVRTC